jgi:hypothetical protein
MLTQRKEGFTSMAIGKWQNLYRRGKLMRHDSSKISHTREVSTEQSYKQISHY